MADSPSTTNGAAQTFDNIMSDVVLNKLLPVVEKLLETEAEAAAPALALPVIKQVFEFATEEVLSAAAHALLQVMVQNGVKLIITIQTEEEKTTYLAAEGALRAALLTKDPVKILAAKKKMDDAANSVIFYDGSVNEHPE